MGTKLKILLVLGLVVGIGFFHFFGRLEWVQHSQSLNVILKLLYVPIILAASWWGLRGGALVGLICSGIYSVEIFRERPWEDPLFYNDIAEIILFTGIGILLGWMVKSGNVSRIEKTQAEQKAEREFRRAMIDPLTKAFNRRYMEAVLKEWWKRAIEGREPFSLLMIDLNHFKFINDHYGHPVGDCVLQATAQTILNQTRPTDFLFRYGGDEFLILLPQIHYDRALTIARRCREEFSKLIFRGNKRTGFKADFSIGAIECLPRFKNTQELLTELDEALYRAKKETTGATAAI